MGIRERLCFEISRRLLRPPDPHTADFDAYGKWRTEELAAQWQHFSDGEIQGMDVLDFGCGMGNLCYLLARLEPKKIIGVELNPIHVEWLEDLRRKSSQPEAAFIQFVQGSKDSLPFADASFDTLLAFDCVEHIMEPEGIMREWFRVLRPGGKVLIWWSPYRSPWGPHMEAVVPIPWAHVIFGERAVMRTAARIYDLEEFAPRPWHFDADGRRKPNVWREWSTFQEQGYINQLTVAAFHEIVGRIGFHVARFDAHGFKGTPVRKLIGATLVRVPILGEYMTSYYIVECAKPLAR